MNEKLKMIEQKENIFCLEYIDTVCFFFQLWLTPTPFTPSPIMITSECLVLCFTTTSKWICICKTQTSLLFHYKIINTFAPIVLVAWLVHGSTNWIFCPIQWPSNWIVFPTPLPSARSIPCPIHYLERTKSKPFTGWTRLRCVTRS